MTGTVTVHLPATAPVIGIGTDLVDVAVTEALIGDHPPTAGQEWTAREIKHAAGRAETFAGMWAAKEAVMKSLGLGIGDVAPSDVEIVHDTDGRPAVVLHGPARHKADQDAVTSVHVSVSHESDLALAFAVACGNLRVTS